MARYGGDEFVLFVPTVTDEATLNDRIAHLVDRIEEPIDLGTTSVRVSASVGAFLAEPGTPLDVAIDAADRAMYDAKKSQPTANEPGGT